MIDIDMIVPLITKISEEAVLLDIILLILSLNHGTNPLDRYVHESI